MPTPRFVTSIANVHPLSGSRQATSSGTTTSEPIEGEGPNGTYIIRGMATPTRTPTQFDVGDIVTVLWQRGLPFMILDMASRKGPGTDEPFGDPFVVEELFIATDPKTGKKEVWFRNALMLVNMNLRAKLPNDPEQVKWGARGDSFFVRVDTKYFIFRFTRGRLDETMKSAPKPKLLRSEFPWSKMPLLSTITYTADVTLHTPNIWSTLNQTVTGPGGAMVTTTLLDGGAATGIERGSTKTAVTELRLTEALAPFFTITDADLDWKYNLILVIVFRPSGLVSPPVEASLPKVAAKAYERHENPTGNVISETGDPTALSQQCVLNGPGGQGWNAQSIDGDDHAIIVNATTGAVLWSSIPLAKTVSLTSTQFTTDAAVATFADAISVEQFFLGITRRDVSGSQGTNTIFSQPLFGAPPVDANAGFVDVAVPSITVGNRAIFDPIAIAFLNFPDPIVGPEVDIITTAYSHVPFANRGTQIDGVNQPGMLNLYAKYLIHNDTTPRGNRVRLYPLQYLPRRSTNFGDLFLFALCDGLSSSGNTVSRKFSMWKYSTDTKKAVALMDWTNEPIENNSSFGNPVLIGVSLRHIMWMVDTISGSEPTILERKRIFLTGIVGTAGTLGATKTLLDLSWNIFGSQPPAIAAFLARPWEVVRPDLLYMLDDPDKKVSTKFLIGWDAKAITLDPAKLVPDVLLTNAGKLKALTAGVLPQFDPELNLRNTNPSVRALVSRSRLKSRFLPDK